MTLKVVLFTANYDTGGQGYRIKRALDRYAPDVSARSIHTTDSYFQYPYDLRYSPGIATKLLEEADVLHFRNAFSGLKRFGHGQPLILHHHGSRFREYHQQIAAEAEEKGAFQLASTLDLTLLEPNVTWLPAPVSLEEFDTFRVKEHDRSPSQTIRIAHAPTNRAVKSTLLILEAVQTLANIGLPVTLDLIERRPWVECLRRKAKADIYVDQLELGYGNNAVEAWALGIPVIAGVVNHKAREAMIDHWGQLPFYEASAGNLVQCLIDLIESKSLRAYWANVGLSHLVRYHDERLVANQLATIYRIAVASEGRVL